MKATRREFEKRLGTAEARTRCEDGRNAGTNPVMVKLSKFDEFSSRTVFRLQFEAVADHNKIMQGMLPPSYTMSRLE
jgi:hypothetical protein